MEDHDDDSSGEDVNGEETGEVSELRAAICEARELQTEKDQEIATLQQQLEKERERYRKLWSV